MNGEQPVAFRDQLAVHAVPEFPSTARRARQGERTLRLKLIYRLPGRHVAHRPTYPLYLSPGAGLPVNPYLPTKPPCAETGPGRAVPPYISSWTPKRRFIIA